MKCSHSRKLGICRNYREEIELTCYFTTRARKIIAKI